MADGSQPVPKSPEAMEAAGFRPVRGRNFTATLGTIWRRGEEGAREVAILSGQETANDFGKFVHGGALMALADIALGSAARDAAGHTNLVTAQLNYHFAGACPAGALVSCKPELVRRTKRLAFVRGVFTADGAVIGHADAMFSIQDPA